ncbi:hypothetical protein DL98DRAFT_149402 [Cadophora sp. DSE1049]|nr:hypothetical protein DL98DRAFT_149402 [Cadophora sp. DSE1049]
MASPSHNINSSSEEEDNDNLPIIFEPEDDSFFSLVTNPSSGATTPRQDTMKEVQVPKHPIPSMQAAFAESMHESSAASTPTIPKNRVGNAAARRKLLIDQDANEDTHASRWKQKPGQQYHELWKLMAQISFGVYLLINGIAKDDEQVMNILQGHVDEVDEFLETTLEDFDLAQEDIEERLKFLKLPLENIIIFDAMLEDRNFRLQIVNGNERIEHVITRTAKAMNDALKDVQQGLDACKAFTIYLAQEQEESSWLKDRPDMQKVFIAMKGNVEGWYKAYVSLQTKGNHLGVALVQLGSIVAEMDRRAGEISRKIRFSSASPEPSPMASPPDSPESKLMRQSMLKTLPEDPNIITPAIRATLPAFQLVQDRERTPEPDARRYSTEEEEGELEFTLKPHTYTPVPSPLPSPRPPTAPVQAPPSPPPEVQRPPEIQQVPEIRQRSSLRKRFSLGKRKETPPEITLQAPPPLDTYWSARQRVTSAQPTPHERQSSAQNSIPRDRQNSNPHERPRERQNSVFNERQNSPRDRQNSIPRERQTSITTPPSRGLDSAYCSDFEKNSPQTLSQPTPLTQTTSHQSSGSHNTNGSQSNVRHQFARDFVPSPRSDQQFFRPIQASPHSPLQRPWTAGPSNPLHMHSNSSTSNLSSHRDYHHSHTPSQLGNRRGAPSTMGMSVMSDMTMMTEVDGNGERKKVKKKRSAFGWLKKAFSLSEEEKAAFEEKRKGLEGERREYYSGQRQRWVDGKRVR